MSRALTGAWIETERLLSVESWTLCRALTGAWIETIFIMLLMDLVVSHEVDHQFENLFF